MDQHYGGQPQQGGGQATAQPEIEENNNDLLKMAENAQLFLGKSTNMNPPQYAEFWLSPKIASFGTVLLSKILMAITGEEKTTSITELIKKITNNCVPPVPELTKLPEVDAEDILCVGLVRVVFLFCPAISNFGFISIFQDKLPTPNRI
jgi:hypothetical protein